MKRKAKQTTVESDFPPPKRRTRSYGPLLDTQFSVVPHNLVPHGHTAIGSTDNLDLDVLHDEQDHLPRHRRARSSISVTHKKPSADTVALPLQHRMRRRANAPSGNGENSTMSSFVRSRQGEQVGDSDVAAGESSSAPDVPIARPSEVQPVANDLIRRSGTGATSKGLARSHSKMKVPEYSETIDDKNKPAAAEDVDESEEPEEQAEAVVGPETNQSFLTAEASHSPRPITSLRDARASTPARSPASRSAAGTPRYIMHSVQITTPSWLENRSTRGIASANIRGRSSTPSVLPLASSKASLPAILSTHNRAEATKTPQLSFRHSLVKSIAEQATPYIAKFPIDINQKLPVHGSSRIPLILPEHLVPCLQAQKQATLTSLHALPQMMGLVGMNTHTNTVAHEQLTKLLLGTVTRGEGNSCLITGPCGSGKTRLVEDVIGALPEEPNVIRLSGYTQTNDRLAIREIAWQLAQQTGTSLLPLDEDTDANNPFSDKNGPSVLILPPSSHLLALISMIPTLSRPTIIVLDGFDLFALHPRQSLLYCLFDTVQHSRVGANGKGLAVIGITPRIDTINLLEKRVKSRFSGRIFRTACPGELSTWTNIARRALCAPIDSELSFEWAPIWGSAVERLLEDKIVQELLLDTFSLTRDLRLLSRGLIPPILQLTPTLPFPSAHSVSDTLEAQRCPTSRAFYHTMTYPSMCLLVAAMHAQTSGHQIFTFEMLHEIFSEQVRASLSVPVQVQGGGIGMVRCSREILMIAFEQLVCLRTLVAVSKPPQGSSKGFTRYRCVMHRAEVKQVVEKMGQLSLKKWLTKAQ